MHLIHGNSNHNNNIIINDNNNNDDNNDINLYKTATPGLKALNRKHNVTHNVHGDG